MLEQYGEVEAALEGGPYASYRKVLAGVVEALGRRWGFTPSPSQTEAFAGSVAEWPVFPDVPDAMRGLGSRYVLGVVSNIDDDLFTASARRIGARIDWVVTAQQVGAYKPSPSNFRRAIERAGVPRERILHVAQSKYHDIRPAREMGLRTAWVNRRHGQLGSGATQAADVEPDLEVHDLIELVVRLGA